MKQPDYINGDINGDVNGVTKADDTLGIAARRPKLLLVDDQAVSSRALYGIFKADYDVFLATNGVQALAFCEGDLPDLILLDMVMPGMDGSEVCRRLKADSRTCDIPVIFVTAKDDPDIEAECLRIGAVDFITKPVNATVVRARVNTHLLLRNMLLQVWQLAFHDTLTRLPNRRLLNNRLLQAMAASQRSGCYSALMFLDLDNFKPLNDAHGHEVGDQLLTKTAARLTACVRKVDTVARFGGDEFVVLLHTLTTDKSESIERATLVAEKIRAALFVPYQLDLDPTNLSAGQIEHRCAGSIGVVLFHGNENIPSVLLKAADAAMYQAKEGGRNRVHFFKGSP